MTPEDEAESIKLLGATVDELLAVVPDDEVILRGHLQATRVEAQKAAVNSSYWWKRTLQLFGNRVLEIRETIEESKRPAWIRQARDIIEQARS